VTQQLIDETRLAPENVMLADMQNIVNVAGDLHSRGPHGETPVCRRQLPLPPSVLIACSLPTPLTQCRRHR